MRDEFLVFGSPLIEQAEIDEVVDSLRSGWIGTGPKVARFERMLEAYLGVPHVRCVSSCTAGLILGLRALGVGPGDEVVLPTMTFVASANAVELVGARPVFVDSVDETGLMDLDAAERAIGPATKALMVVHLGGRPLDMQRVNAIRDRHGIVVVEDAAHAIGAGWHGVPIGGHGNLTCYSFYATKNITTAEGGAIATTSRELADEIERQALHGLSVGAWRRYSDHGFRHYTVEEAGYKFNLTDLHAALGIHQLPRLDGWIDRRAQLAERYDRLLRGLPLTPPPAPAPETRHAHHLYSVLLTEAAPVSRDDLLDHLDRQRIGAGVHYLAVHLHPYYRDRYAIDAGDYPVAESISERTLSLPLSPKLQERDQDDVVEALTSALCPVNGKPAEFERAGEGAPAPGVGEPRNE
jgi:dTDP-4-amino-4,6-dideoxygalactose transaminase